MSDTVEENKENVTDVSVEEKINNEERDKNYTTTSDTKKGK